MIKHFQINRYDLMDHFSNDDSINTDIFDKYLNHYDNYNQKQQSCKSVQFLNIRIAPHILRN